MTVVLSWEGGDCHGERVVGCHGDSVVVMTMTNVMCHITPMYNTCLQGPCRCL